MHSIYAIAIAVFALGVDSSSVPLRTRRQEIKEQVSGRKLALTCFNEVVPLSFEDADLAINNLCGYGPDTDTAKQVMLFENVGTYGGDSIDIVISSDDCSTYEPKDLDGSKNGLKFDDDGISYFASINMMCDHSATFKYTFYKGGTYGPSTNVANLQPLVLPAFSVSFFDIDEGNKVSEDFAVKGWTYALYDDSNSEADFSEEDGFCGLVTENCLHATSKSRGAGCDNPVNPATLSTEYVCDGNDPVNQLARSFELNFENTSSFEFYFAANELKSECSGRNALFAFESAWDDHCVNPVPPPNPLMDDALCLEDL